MELGRLQEEATTVLFKSGLVELTHMPIQKQILEIHGYTQPLKFFEENPRSAYEMCMRIEEKLSMAFAMCSNHKADMEIRMKTKDESLRYQQEKHDAMVSALRYQQEKHDAIVLAKDESLRYQQEKHNAIVLAKDESSRDQRENHDAILSAKDESLKFLQDKCSAEQRELKSLLSRANNEILKLAHSLSVRGMLEKIEYQFSEKRRSEGKNATRKAVWIEIFNEHEQFKQAAMKTCIGRNIASKIDNAASIVVDIYQQRSDEIHHAGYDEIPVKIDAYHGQQLDILRELCFVAHYIIKEF